MNILLIGSGGREHALAWKISQSPKCAHLYCAPGNAGIAEIAECVDIAAEDIKGLVAFAQKNNIGFVIPGPEITLVAGIVDACRAVGITCFGPTQAAARLEGSKRFMKEICDKAGVPTAAYKHFTDYAKAEEFIKNCGTPVVVKADGLAAGKGVVICNSAEEAANAARYMIEEYAFGAAGQEIVIEEFLDGEEISFFALCDGENVVSFGSAQDHKRAYDNDTGPNTGGMGAYSPARLMTTDLEEKIMATCIKPILKTMAHEGVPFTGVLFAGLMVKDGKPKILEYNVRFGDPECQILMTRFEGDVIDLLYATATETLNEISMKWSNNPALTVVIAATGYPAQYQKETIIKGIETAETIDGVKVFHAGTARAENGDLINIGGRVLNVTATGADLKQARSRAYAACEKIDWPESFYRRDIAWRAL